MMDDLVTRLRGLANSDSRAGEPLGKCMREAADEIERLQQQVTFWRTCWEDEAADHEATLKHANKERDEYSA